MQIRDIRLAQLEVLLAEHGHKKAALATTLKRSPSQISQWLSGFRTITEDSAREIEANARKPRGWLDAHGSEPTPDEPVVHLADALPVVLDAMAASPARMELRQLLPMLIDTDAPAYRQRLAELLAAASANAAAELPNPAAKEKQAELDALSRQAEELHAQSTQRRRASRS